MGSQVETQECTGVYTPVTGTQLVEELLIYFEVIKVTK